MDNPPPYREMPSDTPPPPPGSGFTYYPERNSQEYTQPASGYGAPPGYPPPGPGYGPPPGYAPPGPAFVPPPGYAPPGPAFVPSPVYAPVVGVYAPEMPDPGKGMAIAGFVLGIVSVFFGLCTLYGAIANILIGGLGLTFSIMGRKSRTSHGLAIAGLIMSIIGIVIALIWVVIVIAIIIASATAPHNPSY